MRWGLLGTAAAIVGASAALAQGLAQSQTPGQVQASGQGQAQTSAQSKAQAQTAAQPQTGIRPAARLARSNLVASRPRIDWQAVRSFSLRNRNDSLLADMAPRFTPEVVDAIDLPILLPDLPALRANGRLYAFGDYYSISFKQPDAQIQLSGAGRPIRLAPGVVAMAKPEGDTALTVQRTVDGRLASWTMFGVLYTAEVTCDSPKAPACRDESFVRDLVARHRSVMMGKNARKAAGLE